MRLRRLAPWWVAKGMAMARFLQFGALRWCLLCPRSARSDEDINTTLLREQLRVFKESARGKGEAESLRIRSLPSMRGVLEWCNAVAHASCAAAGSRTQE